MDISEVLPEHDMESRFDSLSKKMILFADINKNAQPVTLDLQPEVSFSFSLTDTLPEKKNGKKHNAPSKFDEKKDVTKDNRKQNVFGIVGFVSVVFELSLALIFGYMHPAIFITVFLICWIGFWLVLTKKEKYYFTAIAVIGFLMAVFSALLYAVYWFLS